MNLSVMSRDLLCRSNESMSSTDSQKKKLKYMSVPWLFIQPTHSKKVTPPLQQQSTDNSKFMLKNTKGGKLFNSSQHFSEDELSIIDNAMTSSDGQEIYKNPSSSTFGSYRMPSTRSLTSSSANEEINTTNQTFFMLDELEKETCVSSSNSLEMLTIIEEDETDNINSKNQNNKKIESFQPEDPNLFKNMVKNVLKEETNYTNSFQVRKFNLNGSKGAKKIADITAKSSSLNYEIRSYKAAKQNHQKDEIRVKSQLKMCNGLPRIVNSLEKQSIKVPKFLKPQL